MRTAITVPTTTSREVAAEAREFARQHGIEVGTRGRLSRDLFVTYFLSKPNRARDIAKSVGIPVSQRGRLSTTDAVKVAVLVS